MTTLRDIFDYDAFVEAVADGFIRVQSHPDFPELSIANYAEKAQFERHWTPEILASRGLIYNNQTLDVIARGFPKFFNFDDTSQPNPPVGPMIRSTKFDGSLGIMYFIDGGLAIATRGSFASDQAVHATERLNEILTEYDSVPNMSGWDWDCSITKELYDLWMTGYTPLFEIIYPENRIVVDYKGEDRLVLLDVVDNETGASDLDRFDALSWPDKADKTLIPGGFFDTIAGDIPAGEEGFVLYWPSHDFRCKVKSAEYVELHRMVTGLSKKAVWEWLGEGKSTNEIKEQIPDELFGWLDDAVRELNDATAAIVDQVYEDFYAVLTTCTLTMGEDYLSANRMSEVPRPLFARNAQSFTITRPFLFRILDGAQPEDVWKMAWKLVKPVGDTRAFARSEDVA